MTITMESDYRKYLSVNRSIEEGYLDEAWRTLSLIKSNELRQSFIEISSQGENGLKEQVKNGYYYDHCTDSWKDDGWDNTTSTSPNPPNGDCGVCGTIFGVIVIIVCSIICSMQYDECCWSVWCSAICDCIDWCPCI